MPSEKLKRSENSRLEAATALAISALAWLAGDEARLERFLGLSGLGPHNLRQAAADPRFLASVLDHFTGHEPTLVEFARESGVRPEDVAAASALLSASGGRERP